jgi:hypothetical protein
MLAAVLGNPIARGTLIDHHHSFEHTVKVEKAE